MRAKNSGSIDASFICSAGGASGSGFTPQPQLDCPVTPDPLAGRQPPKVGGCRFVNATYSFGVVTLLPGVYCGGLTIKNKTVAILLPGEYIIKDGPLDVDGESTLTGVGVGFYLTGANATFNFGAKTTISLTAPILGPLAGMLFFEDRDAPAGAHKINSRNAPEEPSRHGQSLSPSKSASTTV